MVLGTTIAKAQENKTSIIAGYSTAKLKFKMSAPEFDENNTQTTDANGFFVGLTQEIGITSKYSFKPGILYTNLTSDGAEEDDNKIEYLQIPLLFNYYANEKIFLSAGPKVDFLLEDEDLNDFKKTSFAIGFGIGFQLSEKLDIIANYSIQLSDSLKSEFEDDLSNDFGTEINASVKQNFLNIGLAYNF